MTSSALWWPWAKMQKMATAAETFSAVVRPYLDDKRKMNSKTNSKMKGQNKGVKQTDTVLYFVRIKKVTKHTFVPSF